MTTRAYLSDLLREAIRQRAALAVAAATVGGFTLLNIYAGGLS